MKKAIVALVLLALNVQASGLKATMDTKPLFQGSTLVIQMKKTLVIPKDQQLALDKELGETKRNQLYTEMIMESSVSRLKAKYGVNKHPATLQLIQKYQSLLQNDMKSNSKVGSL